MIKPWLGMGKSEQELKEMFKEIFSEDVLNRAINQAKEL